MSSNTVPQDRSCVLRFFISQRVLNKKRERQKIYRRRCRIRHNLATQIARAFREDFYLINYAGGFKEAVAEIKDLEQAGLDVVWVPEAYSFDAPSAMGYLAAQTQRVTIASEFCRYTAALSLLAMTAAGIDYLSDGRAMLGLGASGPQVIEGFHGVPYVAPVARTREVIEICRQVWRREKVQHMGDHYQIPLPQDRGTGLGKPLKLINHPVRSDIPIAIASLGPTSVAATARTCRCLVARLLYGGGCGRRVG